jgi:hypothetical protein
MSIFLITSIQIVSAVEFNIIEKENKELYQKFGSEKFDKFKEKVTNLLDNGNFTSFFIIAALIGSILFLILSQPIFLQLIVDSGNQTFFVSLLLFLLFIEIFQKFFLLNIGDFWKTYVWEDVDGFWNFFSIVFFSLYFKILLSYLPTFIIQYSEVFVKVFFYIFMFILPILFNFCFADSIDLIDWTGDEYPI